MELSKLNDFFREIQRSWNEVKILIDMAKEIIKK